MATLLTFAGLAGDLAAPWLVRYVAADFAWVGLFAWIAEWIGLVVLIGLSGWECLAREGAAS